MRRKVFSIVALCMLLVPFAVGQRRGAGAGQRGQSAGMGNAGAGQQSQMREQQRLRIHASTQQQQQTRNCTQSMERVRKRLRTMSKIPADKKISSQQASEWREQLRNEMQTMNRDQQALMNGLGPEQESAVRERVQQMQMSREQLEKMSEAMDMELALEAPDPVKVRQQAKEMESTVNRLRTQQQQFNNEMGVD